jgi:hypothetical protein
MSAIRSRLVYSFVGVCLALAGFAVWLLLATGASAAVVLVDAADTTADGGGCGSVANPCNTIQAGVNNAASGDTIVVAPGTYTQNTNVNKTVTIHGGNAGADPRATSCAPALPQTIITAGTEVSADNVIIDGVTVKNVSSSDVYGTGIYYRPDFSGYQLLNSLITNNVFGVYINSNGVNLSTLEHNCFIDNNLPGPASGNGVYSDQGLGNLLIHQNYSENNLNAGYIIAEDTTTVSNVTIDDNDMVNDGDIVFFQTLNSTISNNTSTTSPYMMVYLGGGDSAIDIHDNVGTNDDGGVTLSDPLSYGANSNINIHDNNFDGDAASTAYGVDARAGGVTTGLTVNNNTLTDDHMGVRVDAATSPSITNNHVSGFQISGPSDDTGIRVLNSSGITVNTNAVNGGHIGSCVGGFWGIYVKDSSGNVNGNTVTGIGNGLTTGCQEGRAIEAAGAGTVGISSNQISAYQKSGIIVRDPVVGTIKDNTVTGEGSTSAIAQNGITVTSGAGLTSIDNNNTSGNWYAPESDFSCGILYFPTVTPANSALQIVRNDSVNDEVGICGTNGTASSAAFDLIAFNTVTAFKQIGIYIDGMTNTDVALNVIDGQGNGTTANPGSGPDTDTRYYGIFAVDSSGNMTDHTIHGITYGPSNGLQGGVGIRVSSRPGGSSSWHLLSNDVYDYQKGGIVVTNVYGGASVSADIDGNNVTGSGPVNYIAQNGIQVSNGATANVHNNDVSQNDYSPSTVSAVGVLILDAGTVSGSSNNVHDNMENVFVQNSALTTFNGNTITNARDTGVFVFGSSNGTYDNNFVTGNAIGLYNADGAGNVFSNSKIDQNGTGIVIDGVSNNVSVLGNIITRQTADGVDVQPFGSDNPTNIVAHQNCIAQDAVYGMSNTATQQVDAENNWWGAADGPGPVGPGSGDKVTANIDFTPFNTSPTNANCPSNVTPTPAPSPTPSPTPLVTNSPTPVVTNSPTPVLTNSPTPVVTNSPTPVVTNSPTPVVTNSPTPVVTNSPTPVVTNSPTPVVTNSPTPVVTNSPTPTAAGATQTPHPGAVGGFVDVVTGGNSSSGSGGLPLMALLLPLLLITAAGAGGLATAFVRRRA